MAHHDEVPDSGAAGAAYRFGARVPGAVCESPGAQDGEGRAGERAVGRGGHAEEDSALETARWDAARDSLRSFHRHSGFGGATAGENTDGTGCRIPADQNQGQTWVGRQRARAYTIALGRHYPE